jgi:hypothetical protein
MSSPAAALRARPATVRGPLRVAVGVASATAVVALTNPNSTHVPLCPFHALTGWWCPLCGSLRAVYALSRGRLATALHDNLLFTVSVPLLLWLWADWVLRARRGEPGRRVSLRTGLALAGLGLLFTVGRNQPALHGLTP